MGSLSGFTSYISGNIFTELTAIYLHKKPFVFICSTCPSREVDDFLGWTASRSGTVGFSRFKVSFIMQSTVMITTINESEELGRIDRNELEAARGCQDKALASRAPEPRKGEGKRST